MPPALGNFFHSSLDMTGADMISPASSFPLTSARRRSLCAGAWLAAALGLPACSGENSGAAEEKSPEAPTTETPAAPPAAASLGHCSYTNPFARSEECRDYLGAGWSEEEAQQDCSEQAGAFVLGSACSIDSVLGRCVLKEGTESAYHLVFPGSDQAQCALVQRGCELFAGGRFEPDARCVGVEDPGIPAGGPVFLPPELECREPLAGEPAGQSDGKVCTWSAIAACTEPGRHFEDYGSCETVLTQRPYWPAPPNDAQAIPDDPRLRDTAYMTEVAWAREQAESCACVCCHSNRITPSGPSNWFVEAEPFWVDSFTPRGLALGAGWVDSTVLGAYPAERNNGFDRSVGFPTTDVERMKRFFEDELARRGYTQADFADAPPFGGVLYDQLQYKPGACENGEGVGADGSLSWRGGGARYVYVLEADAANPLAPPNMDLPEGTIWRLDVRPDANPIQRGLAYGGVPQGASQRFPEAGRPAALTRGSAYYLYVLADIGLPITRCLFNYGG
jgi:hypothetical protein